MKTSTCRQSLEAKIEELVRAEMVGIRASVAAAVDRALATVGGDRPVPTRRRARSQTMSTRRTPEEVAELGERFAAAVAAMPGETMTTIAPQVGATPRELQLPVTGLKRAGRVRSVGKRQYTKYFPAAMSAAAPSA
jgi:hypothetical protein